MPDSTPAAGDAPTLQRARLPNGVELAYDIAGAGEPLVFIHGAMGDWRSWDAQWPAFTPRFRCLRYSRRYSHPNPNRMPSPHHSALDEAEDLRLLLDHLGWERVHLVGSSYGSFTALALAVAQPQRCRALALSEPAMLCYAQFSAAGREAEQAFRRTVIEPANAAFRRGEDMLAAQIMTGGIVGAARPVAPAAMARRQQNVLAMRMLALSSNEFPPDRALPARRLADACAADARPEHTRRSTRRPSPTSAPPCRRPAQRPSRAPVMAPPVTTRPVFNALVLDFLQAHAAR